MKTKIAPWHLQAEKQQRQAYLTGQCIGIFGEGEECAIAFASARDARGALMSFEQTHERAVMIVLAPEMADFVREMATLQPSANTSGRVREAARALLAKLDGAA